MSLLGIHQINLNYKSLRQRVYANLELISNVDEVIQLDVQRSEHQMPGLDSQVLLDVLRTYALYNPEIEYCQGMNYVASFLIMVFKNTEVAFKALTVIVKRFGIADMFNKQLPMIKLFFF